MKRAVVLLCLVLPGCPGPDPIPDAPTDAAADAPRPDGGSDGGRECTIDDDCDDGLFCTGVEQCVMGRCQRGADPCDDGIACTIDSCVESRMRCRSEAPDEDGDGALDAACVDGGGTPLGDDCDDTDGGRYPGALEVCDADDEDCNPTTFGAIDDDGDGYESATCCNGAICGPDCDDARIGSFPGATEVCDGLDQDCDGTPDDGLLLPGFRDEDFDGWGGPTTIEACPGTPGFDTRGGDCNDDPTDANARRQSPGQPEICDTIRNDCDAMLAPDVGAGVVNWYTDGDGDGFGSPASGVTPSCTAVMGAVLNATDCDDADPMVSPAAAERCNGADDNCDGVANYRIVADNFEDDDLDGLTDLMCPGGTDCNDSDPTSGPGEAERCDMRDNDCDTVVDEGATSAIYYRDTDGDGYGSIASGTVVACMLVPGYVPNAGDCNDADASRRPGATETCDAADEDCDAAVDETPASSMCAPPNATASTCVAGRCEVDACVANFDDCDRRAINGCEASLLSDRLNCGRCGNACPGSGLCFAGTCIRSSISPGTELVGTFPRPVTFTIDTPLPASDGMVTIAYTVDGSTPGAPSTIYGAAPLTFAVPDMPMVRVRWRAFFPAGPEATQEFSFVQDTRRLPGPDSPAVRDNTSALVERVDIDGQGPIASVAPGAVVNVTFDIQYWHATTGYCPGCAVYTSITGGGTGGILDCVGNNFLGYPGTTAAGRMFSFTAPMTPGSYPLYVHNALDFVCRPSPGTEIGLLIVR